jgi:predicted dehydrogenase
MNLARINVDQSALTDPRFKALGSMLGATEEHSHAVGLYYSMLVWNRCIESCSYTVPLPIMDAIKTGLGDAMCAVSLSTRKRDGFRIHGTKGRIEWYKKLKEGNRIRQQRVRQRNALVTRDNPGALAPVLSPAPTPTEESEKTTTLVRPRRSNGARVAPAGIVKPSPLTDPEQVRRQEEDFITLYQFYPRHVGKESAWKAFIRLDPDVDTLREIARDIKKRTDEGEWVPGDPERVRFIPHLASYLNQRRWTDER